MVLGGGVFGWCLVLVRLAIRRRRARRLDRRLRLGRRRLEPRLVVRRRHRIRLERDREDGHRFAVPGPAVRHAQQIDDPDQRFAKLVAVDHHVDHAVLEQVLRPLEALRQALADGALDHPRPGEADQRPRLGDGDVAQHGVRGGDAAGGRIGQDDDIGQAVLPRHLHRDGGARHLHQRQDAFLHAGAAGGGDHDQGGIVLDRRAGRRDHRLARRHAHRAAEEVEGLARDHGGMPAHAAPADDDRVVLTGLAAHVLQPVDIALLIAKAQRVGRHLPHRDLAIDP